MAKPDFRSASIKYTIDSVHKPKIIKTLHSRILLNNLPKI